MLWKAVAIGSLISACSIWSGVASAEIVGKYYDPKYTPDITKACEFGSDSIVVFGRKSIDFHENSCKIRKFERWPQGQDMFEFFVTCATGERNQLIIEDSKDSVWVQWRRGPLSDTSGIIYKKCPQNNRAIPPGTLPKKVGECVDTTITAITDRFGHDVMNNRRDTSGTMVSYSNGGHQVSYDNETTITRSKLGDHVKMCLKFVPDHCPPGDERGKIYNSVNLRTGEAWTLPDDQHSCGGA